MNNLTCWLNADMKLCKTTVKKKKRNFKNMNFNNKITIMYSIMRIMLNDVKRKKPF